MEKLQTNENLIDKIYPVGSIYISASSTSPSTLFGGTWEQIKDTFLLAAGSSYSAGSTGGESTVTLTSSQIPSHTHSLPSHTHSFSATTGSSGSHTHGMYYFSNYTENGSNQSMYYSQGTGTVSGSNAMESSGSHTHSVSGTTGSTSGTSGSTGSGSSHNNMPPYLTVYMWQRTA